MIRMFGKTVQVCRYRVDWTEPGQEARTAWAHTRQEADSMAARTGGTVTEADTAAEDWMEGLTFESRDQALSWLEQGEAAYAAERDKPTEADRLAALESAMLALMGGMLDV